MEIIEIIFVFIFGLIIGSFLNALIWRVYLKKSLIERSQCPKCLTKISWYDNIPLLSFILLGGRCRYCYKKISWQYPIVELVTGILFLLAWINNNYLLEDWKQQFVMFRDFFVIAVMIFIFVYDLRWYLILDKIVLPTIALIFVLNIIIGYNWQNLIFSAIIGSSFFLIQYIVSRGKWIGGGDIRLGALMGVILGWPNVILAIFLAYILGSIIGLGLVFLGKKKMNSSIPLGTFLSLATVLIVIYKEICQKIELFY